MSSIPSVPDPAETPSPCIVTDSWHDSVVVIRCVGDLDMLTVGTLERQIDTAMKKKPSAMIIDLAALDFLASVGMGLLVDVHDRCADTTQFMVVADGPATSRPMRMIGLGELFALHATLEDAFGAVKR